MRIVTSLASCILLVLAAGTAAAQARQYLWADIDCRQSRIAAWPGLKCRATNVVTSEGNIGVFRQWAAYGTSRDGYYAHLFLWEAQNSFSYLSADETTADFVKGIFEYGKSIAQVTPVARYRDADYVTFKDGKAGQDLHRLPACGQTATRRLRLADGRHPVRTVGEDHQPRRYFRLYRQCATVTSPLTSCDAIRVSDKLQAAIAGCTLQSGSPRRS